MEKPPIIDAHTQFGPSLAHRRDPFGALWALSEARQLVGLMDEAGIDRAVTFAPAWCGGDDFFDPEYQQANDAVFRGVREYPERLIGFARVNPRYGAQAARELDRCFRDHEAKGLALDPEADGFLASDLRVSIPLVEQCRDRRAPVFVRCGFPPAQPGPMLPLAERFPEVSFIIGHMGLRVGQDAMRMAQRLPNVFLETSLQTASLLHTAINAVGVGRLLFGSAVPYGIPRAELRKITARKDIPADHQALILGGNMGRILGLREASDLQVDELRGGRSDGYYVAP